MADYYTNWQALQASEEENVDFRVDVRQRESTVSIIAPHGGRIEPGTSELATAIAGHDFNLYLFEGLKSKGNAVLHITSHRFDEPRCLALAKQSDYILAIHGCNDLRTECASVYVGGAALHWRQRLLVMLRDARFKAAEDFHTPGTEPSNVCNRGRGGAGVQMELSRRFRRTLFGNLTPAGRKCTTQRFAEFVGAVRQAVAVEAA